LFLLNLQFIVVCNAGLSTGLLQEQVLDEINRIGNVLIENVVMIPGKSYCFLQFITPENAETVHSHMNASTKLGQNDGVLYLSYSKGIPKVDNPWNVPPPAGLVILKDFISDVEEKLLLSSIDWNEIEDSNSSLKHRQVKHYGYEFIYGANNVNPDQPLLRKIPEECNFLWQRLSERCSTFNYFQPDQMTVNRYQPGHGIPPHCDTHSPFEDPIVSLSLGGDTVMDFATTKEKCSVDLPGRTLLVMSGESRYGWTHGIVPRHMDIVQIPNNGGLTVRKRTERISFTFRKLRMDSTPCICKFPTLCDSQKLSQSAAQDETAIGQLASKLEEENVHKVYNEIGSHFSETRHSPWPKVREFIEALPAGGILLDVGCGNGKYLNVNDTLVKVSFMRCELFFFYSHGRPVMWWFLYLLQR
jgi:alkylated DNA repair protein alkB homolog 8